METHLVRTIQDGVQAVGRWYRGSRLLRIGCWFGVAALALIIIGKVLIDSWLIPKALEEMTHNLASAGIHLKAQEAEMELLRGSIALEGLTLYRTSDREDPVLFLSGARIEIDLKQLIFDQTFWGEAQVRDGTLVFYGEQRHTEYANLNVDLDLSAEALQIQRFEGTGLGYQVSTTGFLRWGSGEDPVVPESEEVNRAKPGETSPLPQEPVAESGGTPSYPDCPADFDWMESLAELFACESTGENPAQLNLIVEWDQTKAPVPAAGGPGGASLPLTVEGSVSGKEVIWLGLPLESINSEFKIENDEVRISHAEFVGMGGEFQSAGVYDIATSRLIFHSPTSTMDPILLLRNLQIIDPSEWPTFDFGESMPKLVGDELRIDFNELSAPIISMSIDAPGGFSFREHAGSTEAILVDSFRGNVEFRRPGELSIREIKTRSGGLDVTGQFTYLWDTTRATEPDGAGQATISRGNGDPKQPSPPNSAEPSSRFSLTRTVNHLLTFESVGDSRPTCSLDLVWDSTAQSAPDNPFASCATGKGKFAGTAFKWHEQMIGLAEVELEFDDGLISVSQLEFDGLGGTLNASGEFDIQHRTASIPSLDSSLDLAELKSHLGIQLDPVLDSLSFPSPPSLTGRGLEVHLDNPAANLGKFGLVAEAGFTIGTGDEALTAESLKLAMDWKAAGELAVEQASASIAGLEIETSGILRWRAEEAQDDTPGGAGGADAQASNGPASKIPSPENGEDSAESAARAAIVWIRDWMAVKADGAPVRLTARIDWDQHRVTDEEQGDGGAALAGLVLDGELSGGNCTWRDIAIKRIQSKFSMGDGQFKFAPFELQTGDGKITARGSYQTTSDLLRLDSVGLDLKLQPLLREFEIDSSGPLAFMEFPGSPKLEGSDLSIDFADARRSRGSIDVHFPQGIKLLAEQRSLLLEDVRGSLRLQDGMITSNNLRAAILEGNAGVNFQSAVAGNPKWYKTSVSIENVSMDALNRWLVPEDKTSHKGNFDLQFTGEGVASLETLVGQGRVLVDSDESTAQNFPIIDGLIGFLEGLIPVLEKKKVWTLDLPFTVKDSIISAVDAKIKGPSIDLSLNGQLDLNTEMVDVGVGVNLRGLVGITTGLLTFFRENLVDITGKGKLGAIEWEKARRATTKAPPASPTGNQKRKKPGILNRR